MSVISNFKIGGEHLEDQVFTLKRIWWTKDDHKWNGVFEYGFGIVEVGVDYTDENPRQALYAELMRRLTQEGFLPRSDEEPKPKKRASKRS